jgi:CO/xanthine dehydrogenase FAD-binding subunit
VSASFTTALTVEEALAAVASGARPVAGGTDLVVGARQGKAALPDTIVAIDRLPELGRIAAGADGGLEIGAGVTHAALLGSATVRDRYAALGDACAIVGSHATRAHGTIGGNVMNASPAMDTGGPLLCFGALAVLASNEGTRSLPLDELWLGPGRTAAQANELLVSLSLPPQPERSGSCYVRLEYRRQMEIAVVGVTAAVAVGAGRIESARVAITALTPTIRRVRSAEDLLVGTEAGEPAIRAAAAAVAAEATPISDVRASAEYRQAMAERIARRAILGALRRASGERVAIPASDTLFATD